MTPYYERDGISIYRGNADEVLRGLRHNYFWTLVLDPPYTPSLETVMHMFRWVKNGGKVLMLAADGYSLIPHMAGLTADHVKMPEIAPSAQFNHSVTRPVDCMKLLLALTEGPILDPYMGVGTTLVAAKKLGRQCVGIEIEDKWCRMAVSRLEAA